MRENLFHKILRLEKKLTNIYVQKKLMSKYRKRKIIPDEYFIDVVTSVPDVRKVKQMKRIDF